MTDATTIDATAADPAADPAAAAANAWTAGLEGEFLGHVQNKGWDKLDPAAAAREIAKAHREAERHIGVPADQVLRMPKADAPEADWAAFYSKLGKPAAATDYDVSTVKFADGSDLSADLASFAQNTAHALHLPKEAGARLAAEIAKFLDGADTSDRAETEAKLTAEKAELAKEWGQNSEANLFVAKQAAAKLGVSPEAINALEGQVGYAAVMKMFQKIGTSIGEARFISNDGPNPGVLTREQALARKSELMADAAWTDKYFKGDAQAVREMTSLNVLITGDSGNYERP